MRRARRIVLCLVVGGVCTWVSAWGLMYLRIGGVTSAQAPEAWPVDVSAEWPEPLTQSNVKALGLRFESASVVQMSSPQNPGPAYVNWQAWRVRAGWPMLGVEGSLSGRTPINPPNTPASEPTIITRGVIVLRRNAGELALPVGPAWPGFAINTLVYAGACWLLLAAPGGVRRWRRRRRGRCPACGYERSGLATCPECGA